MRNPDSRAAFRRYSPRSVSTEEACFSSLTRSSRYSVHYPVSPAVLQNHLHRFLLVVLQEPMASKLLVPGRKSRRIRRTITWLATDWPLSGEEERRDSAQECCCRRHRHHRESPPYSDQSRVPHRDSFAGNRRGGSSFVVLLILSR